jgi:hypothetical protein
MVDLDNFVVLLMHLIVGGMMTKKGLLIWYKTKLLNYGFIYVRNVLFILVNDTHHHNLSGVWLEELKFNKHCNIFVLFDKKFPILD